MSNNLNRAAISQQLQQKTNHLKQIEQVELGNYRANLNQQYQSELNHSMTAFAQDLRQVIESGNQQIMSELSKHETIPQTVSQTLTKTQDQLLKLTQRFLDDCKLLIQNQDQKIIIIQEQQTEMTADLKQWKMDTLSHINTNKNIPLATWLILIAMVGVGMATQLTEIISNGKTWIWLSVCLAIILTAIAVWAVTVAIKKANSED